MPDLGVERVEVTLRRLVADEIGDYLRRCSDEGRRPPDEADQRQMARAIVRRELDVRARTALRLGEPQISEVEEDEITESVLAAAFSGRLTGHWPDTDVISEFAEEEPA